MNHPKIIIVGGGIAGLMAALKIAETGCPVQLLSQAPIIRSNSVCSHEGLNAAIDSKKDGDSPEIHFNDTIYGGGTFWLTKSSLARCVIKLRKF